MFQAKLDRSYGMDQGILFDSAPNKRQPSGICKSGRYSGCRTGSMDAVLDTLRRRRPVCNSFCHIPGCKNQNAWIDAKKKIMEEDEKYSKLELVELLMVMMSLRNSQTRQRRFFRTTRTEGLRTYNCRYRQLQNTFRIMNPHANWQVLAFSSEMNKLGVHRRWRCLFLPVLLFCKTWALETAWAQTMAL